MNNLSLARGMPWYRFRVNLFQFYDFYSCRYEVHLAKEQILLGAQHIFNRTFQSPE